jgi:hypothetical protein
VQLKYRHKFLQLTLYKIYLQSVPNPNNNHLLNSVGENKITLNVQGGNFNWNKIHNLEIGNFCKKFRNRSIFIFPCPHFDAYGFCTSAPGSAQLPPTFFFSNGRVCQVAPCIMAISILCTRMPDQSNLRTQCYRWIFWVECNVGGYFVLAKTI